MHQRDARLLLAAHAASVFFGYFGFVTTAALSFSLSRGVALMALQLGCLQLAPILAEAWAARWAAGAADRRVAMVVGELGCAAAALLLAWSHHPWQLLVLTGAGGLAGTLGGASRGAFAVQVVGAGETTRLNAAKSTLGGALRLAGPVLAGTVVAGAGPRAAFILNAVGYVASAVLTLLIRPRPRSAGPGGAARAGVAAGYRALLSDPRLRGALAIEAWLLLGEWAVSTAWLAWVQSVAFGGTAVMGAGIAAYEGGSVAAGLLLPRLDRAAALPLALAGALAAGAWCLYPLVHAAWPLVALSAAEGAAQWTVSAVLANWIQHRVPDAGLGQSIAAEGQIAAAARLAGTGLALLLGRRLGFPAGFPLLAALAAAGWAVTAALGTGRRR